MYYYLGILIPVQLYSCTAVLYSCTAALVSRMYVILPGEEDSTTLTHAPRVRMDQWSPARVELVRILPLTAAIGTVERAHVRMQRPRAGDPVRGRAVWPGASGMVAAADLHTVQWPRWDPRRHGLGTERRAPGCTQTGQGQPGGATCGTDRGTTARLEENIYGAEPDDDQTIHPRRGVGVYSGVGALGGGRAGMGREQWRL